LLIASFSRFDPKRSPPTWAKSSPALRKLKLLPTDERPPIVRYPGPDEALDESVLQPNAAKVRQMVQRVHHG
jgi:hypothetical protein